MDGHIYMHVRVHIHVHYMYMYVPKYTDIKMSVHMYCMILRGQQIHCTAQTIMEILHHYLGCRGLALLCWWVVVVEGWQSSQPPLERELHHEI